MPDVTNQVAEAYGVDPDRVHDQTTPSETTSTDQPTSNSDNEAAQMTQEEGGPLPLTVTIPGKPPSLNQFYAGMHWSKRKKCRDKWHRRVQRLAPSVEIETYPVAIEAITFFGAGRRYDAENLAACSKLITDGLVEAGVLRGDGPKEVRRVSLEARRMEEDGHKTRYRITEWEGKP